MPRSKNTNNVIERSNSVPASTMAFLSQITYGKLNEKNIQKPIWSYTELLSKKVWYFQFQLTNNPSEKYHMWCKKLSKNLEHSII